VIKHLAYQINKNGYIHNQEISFITKEGQNRFAIFSAEKIVLDGVCHILGMATDVTDMKLMKSELVRLDRLNLVGQMAAGISHEVRNPMTTVRGFLQMLLKKEDCKQYRDYFELMISELDRANLILSEFLSVAKPTPATYVETDLNAIIRAIEPLMTTDAVLAGNNIVLKLDNTRRLLLNEKEIRQLLLNLVRNALEAMTRPGTVTIRTYEEAGQVVLAIQD
jgi:signal transduction histidine kinase